MGAKRMSNDIKTGTWGVVRQVVMEPDATGGWSVRLDKSGESYIYTEKAAAERSARELGERNAPSIVIIRTAAGSVQSEKVFLLKA